MTFHMAKCRRVLIILHVFYRRMSEGGEQYLVGLLLFLLLVHRLLEINRGNA